MKKNISIQGIFLGAVMLLGMSVSCQDDIEQQGHGASADRILLSIGEGSSVGSRSEAGVWSNRYLMTVGKDSLFVGLTEEVNAVAVESRGASITTGNIESFYLAAYEDDGKTWVYGSWQKDAEGNTILKDGETNWKFNPDKNWPEDYRALHFHGYAATLGYDFTPPTFSIGVSGDSKTYQGTFDYTIPTSQGKTKSDATSQPDLIVALTPNQNRKVDVVDIDFYHALSAVIFKAGDMPENTKLKSITLKGVNSEGTCTYYTATDSNVPSFKWTSSEPKNYTQTFGSDLKDNTDITTTASEAAFMMIPQPFSDKAIVSVEVVVNEGDYERTYTSNMKLMDLIRNVTAWKAHHKYTYTLSLKEGVTVDVTDQVSDDGKTKDNVVIKNTGESTSYIRAAIVGQWVSEAGVILSPWNIKDAVGTFVGLDNDSWLQGSDGFFYHNAPVAPGKTTDALFNSYKLNATAPIIGAELEFNIVVQAIHKQQVTHSGWPVTVGNDGKLSLNN